MGGKKKRRQELTSLSSSSSFRSSSYRQENVSPSTQHKTTNIGCMSGIFHIMSKYHTRRKFLTFGKKQERNAMVQPPTQPPQQKNQPPKQEENTLTRHPHDHPTLAAGRLSLDQPPQSPALTPEVRRSSSDTISPRIVHRLMGLDDFPASPPPHAPPSREVDKAAEKRRKLLGALEKCDEDLKVLKKIIEKVREAQTPPPSVGKKDDVEEGESEVGSEGPSPVSVLDHYHLSPCYTKRIDKDQHVHQTKKIRHQKQQLIEKKSKDHEEKAINFINKPSLSSYIVTTTQPPLSSQPPLNTSTPPSATPWSSAMKESVIEVCREIEWGQTQEVGRIGLLLQDFIFKDLIDEIIVELSCANLLVYTTSTFNLPFEVCKKRLCF